MLLVVVVLVVQVPLVVMQPRLAEKVVELPLLLLVVKPGL